MLAQSEGKMLVAEEWERARSLLPIAVGNKSVPFVIVTGKMTKTFGSANVKRWTIKLSKRFAQAEAARDVVRHEIAHLLVPNGRHGQEWKAAATILGANPTARGTHEIDPALDAPYQFKCKNCDAIFKARRVTKLVRFPALHFCKSCGPTAGRLERIR